MSLFEFCGSVGAAAWIQGSCDSYLSWLKLEVGTVWAAGGSSSCCLIWLWKREFKRQRCFSVFEVAFYNIFSFPNHVSLAVTMGPNELGFFFVLNPSQGHMYLCGFFLLNHYYFPVSFIRHWLFGNACYMTIKFMETSQNWLLNCRENSR